MRISKPTTALGTIVIVTNNNSYYHGGSPHFFLLIIIEFNYTTISARVADKQKGYFYYVNNQDKVSIVNYSTIFVDNSSNELSESLKIRHFTTITITNNNSILLPKAANGVPTTYKALIQHNVQNLKLPESLFILSCFLYQHTWLFLLL